MKKLVLKLDIHDDKAKQKAMKIVSTIDGIDSIAIDMKEKKLTVTGPFDPMDVVKKLRKKKIHAEILSLGPAKKEEEKKKEQQLAEFVWAYQTHNPYYPPYYMTSL